MESKIIVADVEKLKVRQDLEDADKLLALCAAATQCQDQGVAAGIQLVMEQVREKIGNALLMLKREC